MRPCCYICYCSDKCLYILSFAVQVKDVMKDVMADLQQTNSEKILLSWVRQSTKNYKDLNVVNFSSTWADGFAFNALIHSHRCVGLLFLGAFLKITEIVGFKTNEIENECLIFIGHKLHG